MERTIGIQQAAREDWDAIVVGAGPAGAIASRQLSRLGAKVLLVDKASFPRFKACGSCLSPRSLECLNEVGLSELPGQLGARSLTSWILAAGGSRAELKLAGHVSLSREAFDTALIGASIAAGSAFLPGTRAGIGSVQRGARRLTVKDARCRGELTARIVIDARGLGARSLGARRPRGGAKRPDRRPAAVRIGAAVLADASVGSYEASAIHMSCGTHGYVGAVRLEDGRLDVAAALNPAAVKRSGLGSTAARIIAEAGLPPIPHLAELPWRGTPELTVLPGRLATERRFAVGDAAGYLEPFTGEGIAWALSAGAAVAPIASDAIRAWDESLCSRWSREYRRVVMRRQWICQAAAVLLRYPHMMRILVGLFARAPWLAQVMIGVVSAPRAAHATGRTLDREDAHVDRHPGTCNGCS